MIIPILGLSISMSVKIIIEENIAYLNEGISILDTEIKKMGNIGNFLLTDKRYINLMLLNGNPKPKNYVDFSITQRNFSKLCAAQNLVTNAYILFRHNPIYISNFCSTDDYNRVYPDYINYRNKTVNEWREEIFAQNYHIKVLKCDNFYNHYNFPYHEEGVTFLINNSYPGNINNISVMACVINKWDIINMDFHGKKAYLIK